MANNYFRFKSFVIHQGHTAMKVCTDACLFGAWVAKLVSGDRPDGGSKIRVLDIGAGTGLLGLMVRQQLSATIDLVELEENAAKQAADNCRESPWSADLKVFHQDINKYEPDQPYDLILSNPPFFGNDLQAKHHARNIARHESTLGLKELFAAVERLLGEDGRFALLLPYHRAEEALREAAIRGLVPAKRVNVSQTPRHDPFRVMFLFARKGEQEVPHAITIQDNGHYTASFVELLRDYYLYL
ncbi:methyltransferase [Flavihumibacter rivuli]|uniref:tRNA1(Val) (adenine(37)-N6)-methyltransferase n=1 Tax=Flavihumibacter rivuli TaxID=2838156 RepID=UPI001BDE52C7|nr:methyltransferase [Flavihumibacter rivuli]ULQ57499.1 methyltransferase [Flavihumibacter rivuli]